MVGILTVGRNGDSCFEECAFVEWFIQRNSSRGHVGRKVLIAVILAENITLGRFLLTDQNINRTGTAYTPNGHISAFFQGEIKPCKTVGIRWSSFGSDVYSRFFEKPQVCIPSRHQIGSFTFFRQGSFGQKLRSQKTKLCRKLVFFIVPVTKFQVKNTRGRIPKFRRKSPRKKIRIGQIFIINDSDRAARGSRNGKVVGIGNIHPFEPPKYARRRIAANHNVVTRIIGPLDSRKIGSHSGGFAPAPGVTSRFFDRKLPRTYQGHFVGGFSVAFYFYHHRIKFRY